MTTWRWMTLPLCFWVTSEPSSNRYEHSTIRWRAKQCTLSFRLESILTDLVLSDRHSIWCTEGDRGDPHWCETGQHYDGESPPATLWSQADRLRSGHSHVTGQEVQGKANIWNYVRQIICCIILERICSLLFLPWTCTAALHTRHCFGIKLLYLYIVCYLLSSVIDLMFADTKNYNKALIDWSIDVLSMCSLSKM